MSEFLTAEGEFDVNAFGDAVVADIRYHSRTSKRSSQKALGPSDIAKQCERAIAYKLLNVPAVNEADPWFSIIGGAVHKWMEDCYKAKNKRLGRERYLVEHRVNVVRGVAGTTDCYDKDLKAIIDWKVVGDSGVKRAKAETDNSYPEQLNQYALGIINKGFEVDWVITVYLPRNNFLSKKFITAKRFNKDHAESALARYASVKRQVKTAGINALPLIRATEHFCDWCPWSLPGSLNLSIGCPGGDATNPIQLTTNEKGN